MFLFALYTGFHFLETRATDPISEQLTIREAKKIALGEHSYGIVEYTHYPNGPQYVMALLMRAGIHESRNLRMAPLIFSALSVGILAFCICISSTTVALMALGLLGIGSVVLQPGVAQWMGALYGHSYSLALCMVGLGISLIPSTPNWTLALVGFLSGWMGYDFTFCLIGSILVGRIISYSSHQQSRVRKAWSALNSAITGAFGIALAILGHFIQNAFYFGSSREAFNDLIGSAAARAGLPIASKLNPGYAHFIDAAARSQQKSPDGQYALSELLHDLCISFTSPEWTDWKFLLPVISLALVVTGCLLVYVRYRVGSWTPAIALIVQSSIEVSIGLVFGVLWYVLMPHHARFHFHFIQRLLFVPLLLMWVVWWRMVNNLYQVGRKAEAL